MLEDLSPICLGEADRTGDNELQDLLAVEGRGQGRRDALEGRQFAQLLLQTLIGLFEPLRIVDRKRELPGNHFEKVDRFVAKAARGTGLDREHAFQLHMIPPAGVLGEENDRDRDEGTGGWLVEERIDRAGRIMADIGDDDGVAGLGRAADAALSEREVDLVDGGRVEALGRPEVEALLRPIEEVNGADIDGHHVRDRLGDRLEGRAKGAP